jgi:hypothetical protein
MFCDEELISHPIPMPDNHPLSVVHYCLSNSYIRSHPVYMEAAYFIRNLRTGHVVVTGKLLALL